MGNVSVKWLKNRRPARRVRSAGSLCQEDSTLSESFSMFWLKEKAAILNSAQAIVTDLVMKVQKLNKRLSGDLRMLDFYNTRLSRPDIGVKCDVDALRPRLQHDANQESGQKLTLQFRLWEMEDERALLQEKLEEAETNNQQLTEQHDQLCQQISSLTAALEKEQTAVKNMDKRQRKLDQLLSKEKAASQKTKRVWVESKRVRVFVEDLQAAHDSGCGRR
nr:hypothetical protein BaRGS_024185 [Batillaria attramentaria]